MVIRSREFAYEVIRALPECGGQLYYLCVRRQVEEAGEGDDFSAAAPEGRTGTGAGEELPGIGPEGGRGRAGGEDLAGSGPEGGSGRAAGEDLPGAGPERGPGIAGGEGLAGVGPGGVRGIAVGENLPGIGPERGPGTDAGDETPKSVSGAVAGEDLLGTALWAGGGAAAPLCLVVRIPCAPDVTTLIPFILEMQESPGFTGLVEFFTEEAFLTLVFSLPGGIPLGEALLEERPLALRFAMGQQIFEAGIIGMVPIWLMWEVLDEDGVWVDEAGGAGFYYRLAQWREYHRITGADLQMRLEALLRRLFQPELSGGLYPEISLYLDGLTGGHGDGELVELYQSYLQLLPVCSQERKKEKKTGKNIWKALKAQSGRILAAVKICLGLTVLAAAAAMLPGMWKQKVKPVIDAAVLWKAVYVDHETQETEPPEEPETAEETQTDPDNGRGERFRKDGSLCYKGGLLDGLYDGRGTLYYPNGKIAYQGEFAFGKKEGEGSQYTDTGQIYYEGGFHRDQFEGQGKLYDADAGGLVYEGEFEGGKYSGNGVLYNPATEFPIYVGEFRIGRYNGQGDLYDDRGCLLYEGEFLLGRLHGKGTLYDPDTGAAVEAGVFRNGLYIGPADEAESAQAGQDASGEEGGAEAAARPPEEQEAAATAHPPEGQEAEATAHPPEGQEAAAAAHPPEGQEAEATAHPPEGQEAAATVHPPEGQEAAAAARPPEGQEAEATARPPEGQEAAATAHPPEEQEAEATAHPPEGQEDETRASHDTQQEYGPGIVPTDPAEKISTPGIGPGISPGTG